MNLKDNIINDVTRHLDGITTRVAESMIQRLSDGGHIDTGKLIRSIYHSTEANEDEINSYVTIDAYSDYGDWYAEFIEHGTGIYRDDGSGRQTPWRYKDRNGEWHTTHGQHPDPFIEPSIQEHIPELEQGMEYILGNTRRYNA